MHFQFLIEDQSSEVLIDLLMRKIMGDTEKNTFNCKSFKGIGGFSGKGTYKGEKKGTLLNDLAIYLRGFDKSLFGIQATIFIVLDNDTRNTKDFYKELEEVAVDNKISIDHVFCIAVEEMEAWLLGDENALLQAYPRAKLSILHTYVQDSICGTWEKLADVVYPGGVTKFKKDCPTFYERGYYKAEWAKAIGQYMKISDNKSRSFQFFIHEVKKRIVA